MMQTLSNCYSYMYGVSEWVTGVMVDSVDVCSPPPTCDVVQ